MASFREVVILEESGVLSTAVTPGGGGLMDDQADPPGVDGGREGDFPVSELSEEKGDADEVGPLPLPGGVCRAGVKGCRPGWTWLDGATEIESWGLGLL